MTHLEIGTQIRALEKARREKIRELMSEYDRAHQEQMRSMRRQCGEIGHNMRFTNLGPLGNPWFHCTVCGASEVRD